MKIFTFLRAFARIPAAVALCVLTVVSLPNLAFSQKLIMPMGDSITIGVDYLTNSSGGYRDPLYHDLTAAGISFTFVGANSSLPTSTLTNANEAMHNGYGSWHIQDLNNNLNGVAAPIAGGDSNLGGYFLTGGNGTGRAAVHPDIVLLGIGTNDILQGNQNIDQDLYSLVTNIHTLSPNSIILIAGITPINSSGFVPIINAYNSYIKTQLVPALSYTRFVDQNTAFTNSDGTVDGALLGADDVHPNRFGYPIMGQNWAAAIEAVLGVSPKTYPLTVNGGFGTASLAAGAVTTAGAATPATNSQFASWTPATTALSNPNNALSVYTMPAAAATLTANYAASGSPLVANGTYEIGSGYDGLAVGAVQASTTSSVQQQIYSGLNTQQWNLVNLGSNVVALELAGTSLALEVPAANASALSASLDVEPYQGGTNQQWLLTPTSGYLQLVNLSSQMAVNISGYSTSAGAQLDQYACGCANNLWSFYPVSSAASTYTLTVSSGSGGGVYAAGSVVSIAANTAPSGYQFGSWTGSINGIANIASASTTMTMPASNASITATYTQATTYPLYVTNGSGQAYYAAGTVVTITANAAPTGQVFAGWTGATSTIASVSSATTTITVPTGGASIAASYTASTTYPLYVTNGSGQAYYAAGTVVTITANAAPSGQVFAGWTGATSTIASVSSATTTITVPTGGASIAASYTQATVYPLYVTNGSGQAYYYAGTVVPISAYGAPSGQVFAGWTGATGTIASVSSATTTITIPVGGAVIAASYASSYTSAVTSSSSTSSSSTTSSTSSSSASSASSTVSIQFVGGGASPLHGSGYDYTAGAHSAGNWNPVLIVGNTTQPQSLSMSSGLTDSTGAASAIGFQLTSSGAYYTGAGTGFKTAAPYPGYSGVASGAGDAFLFAGFGYAGYSNNNPITLTLTGLQASHTYSILAYVTPFEGFGNSQAATVALSGNGSYTMQTDGSAGVYEQAASNGKGNYVEFDNVSGSTTQTLTLTSGGALIGLSGVQIIDGASSTTSSSSSSSSTTTSSSSTTSGSVSTITGVQFVGGGAAPLKSGSWNYTAGAGSYAASNWNSVLAIGNTTTPQALTVTSGLTDWTGAASTIGFQLNASGAYYTGSGGGLTSVGPYPGYAGQSSGAGNSFLYAGFAFAGFSNSSPETITITGLTASHRYSILLYVAPFTGLGDGQSASATVTGGPTYYLHAQGNLSSYVVSSATSAGSATGANYVEFDNLTGASSQTLTLTNTSTLVGISGFQVVDLGAQ